MFTLLIYEWCLTQKGYATQDGYIQQLSLKTIKGHNYSVQESGYKRDIDGAT
ncbi:MAG: hypothetical protein GY775_00485 [Candidatus Scalindua sp.]|nr:hypothetical protein [Candidatus Scalindua sp.]